MKNRLNPRPFDGIERERMVLMKLSLQACLLDADREDNPNKKARLLRGEQAAILELFIRNGQKN